MSTRWLLTCVFVFFMLVLGAAWYISRQAHPVFLDEHGRPVAQGTTTHGHH